MCEQLTQQVSNYGAFDVWAHIAFCHISLHTWKGDDGELSLFSGECEMADSNISLVCDWK